MALEQGGLGFRRGTVDFVSEDDLPHDWTRGLRYLEQYEFRLVRESLAEREVVLRQAPHIVAPLSLVLPHEPHLRPAWMLRAGLFLYDHLGRRETLPASFGVDLSRTPWGAGLKPRFRRGFVYADARVDDARLAVCNVMDARRRGADVRVGTRLVAARRERDADGPFWRATLAGPAKAATEVTAKVLVNVAGPWAKRVRDAINGTPSKENVRHVKGSHIVSAAAHACSPGTVSMISKLVPLLAPLAARPEEPGLRRSSELTSASGIRARGPGTCAARRRPRRRAPPARRARRVSRTGARRTACIP